MRVEILSFDGCSSRDVALERLREVLDLEQVTADVMDVLVADPVAAEKLRFLGSPTVRVNGIDVDAVRSCVSSIWIHVPHLPNRARR